MSDYIQVVAEVRGVTINIGGRTYYRTVEVYRSVGISRTTLYRWVQLGVLGESEYRDRRGWRLFTQEEVDRVKDEVNRVIETSRLKSGKGEGRRPAHREKAGK